MSNPEPLTQADAQTQIAPTLTSNDLNALRIKVAELCPSLFLIRQGTFTKDMTFWNDEGHQGPAVDPTSDLNACAEFEKALLNQSRINDRTTPFHAYFQQLHAECIGTDQFDEPMQAEHWAICATAEQRCRAFVATMESSDPTLGAGSVLDGSESDTASGVSSENPSASSQGSSATTGEGFLDTERHNHK